MATQPAAAAAAAVATAHGPRAPFLAADAGGTHVRVALVREAAPAGAQVEVLAYRKYACADFPGLARILESFLSDIAAPTRVEHGAIACAGHVLADGSLISANLPWPMSAPAIGRQLGFRDLRFVNDFEAVAHAAAHVDASEASRLSGPTQAEDGPVLVVGPGTGLGAALWVPTQRDPVVLATEAGQASLTVGNRLEMDVLAYMLRSREHVPAEHVLSGPGLMHLHAALCALHGEAPRYATPDAISAAAIAGSDARARQALETFCGLLGSAVGDMALFYGPRGGIYLAGGILSQIHGFLQRSSFVDRFLAKGTMRQALERIPVKVVEHGQLGVIGAATWYLARAQDPPATDT